MFKLWTLPRALRVSLAVFPKLTIFEEMSAFHDVRNDETGSVRGMHALVPTQPSRWSARYADGGHPNVSRGVSQRQGGAHTKVLKARAILSLFCANGVDCLSCHGLILWSGHNLQFLSIYRAFTASLTSTPEKLLSITAVNVNVPVLFYT